MSLYLSTDFATSSGVTGLPFNTFLTKGSTLSRESAPPKARSSMPFNGFSVMFGSPINSSCHPSFLKRGWGRFIMSF